MALRERQLDALARWAEAGGSVLIFPGRVDDTRIAFLNRLAAASGAPFSLADGIVKSSKEDEFAFHTGLGRSVIWLGELPSEAELKTRRWLSGVQLGIASSRPSEVTWMSV